MCSKFLHESQSQLAKPVRTEPRQRATLCAFYGPKSRDDAGKGSGPETQRLFAAYEGNRTGEAGMVNQLSLSQFTKIPNELVEGCGRFRMAGEESAVFWVVIRKTYGWHKTSDRISLSQFALATGMRKPHIVRAIRKLLDRNMILVSHGPDGAKSYAIQTDVDLWKPLPRKGTLPKRGTIVTKSSNNTLPKTVPTKETLTQKNPIKEKYLNSVHLTQEEYERLVKDYGQVMTDRFIEKLNNHKMAKDVTYKSDYHAILNWVVDAVRGTIGKRVTWEESAHGSKSAHPVDLVVSE